MPRLSDHQYQLNYSALRDEYVGGSLTLRFLEPDEQWALFAYYRHHERHSAAENREHRRHISELRPELPQVAGRAFKRFLELQASRAQTVRPNRAMRRAPQKRRGHSSSFTVAGQVQPDVDPVRFARILMDVAKFQQEQARGVREDRSFEYLPPKVDSQSSGR